MVLVYKAVQKRAFRQLTHKGLHSQLPKELTELALQTAEADEFCEPQGDVMVSFAEPKNESGTVVMLQGTHSSETERPYQDQDCSSSQILPARHSSKIGFTYIALGSNMGNRIEHIEAACGKLNMAGIRVSRTSALYETKPMYVEDQDPFINGVCEVNDRPLYILYCLPS